jgi:putative ABC transport system permease protein
MPFRDALRALRAAPLVSLAAILSLTLGIGANTAIFSLLNGLLLKPLPVQHPHELVLVTDGGQNPYFALSYPVWKETRARNVFERSFGWATERVNLVAAADTRSAVVMWATGDVFEVLGVKAVLGRTFDAHDDVPGGGAAGPVAVISYQMWQRRYHGASDAIGRDVQIDRTRFTIVGVAPATFSGLNVGDPIDLILPIETEPLLGRTPSRLELSTWTWLQVMARRGPGQTAATLSTALAAAQPLIREATMPAFDHAEDRDRYFAAPWIVKDAPEGFSRLRRQYGPALVTLLWVVGFVLLLACANIATLMLGKSAARRYEFSIRLALGASRRSLVQQLLAESLLLAGIGAVCGVAFARWGGPFLVAQLATWYASPSLDLSLDWRVLAVTAIVTVATAVLFSVAPIYGALRVPAIDALKRHHGGGTGRSAVGLVVAQVGFSFVLVVAAGLFLRSFVALAYRDLGFDRGRVVVAVASVPDTADRGALAAALYDRVREAAASVPGVESAALSLATPLGNAGVRFTPDIGVPGNAALGEGTIRILTTPVSPGWFRTYGTRILAGRDFSDNDRAGTADVAIVNGAFVRRYFDGASPLGRPLLIVASPTARRSVEIVGVVEDAAFATVRDAIEPTVYQPLTQRLDAQLMGSISSISVSIRAADGVPPNRLTGRVADAISRVDSRIAVTFQTVSEQLSAFYIRERLLAMLSGFFGVLALLLAAIGLYGSTAYSVNQRRFELGVRMALGATVGRVMRLVLSRVSILVALGLLAGTIASLFATRYIGSLLYRVPARGPFTMATAAVTLALCAAIAGWLPARRAARTNPTIVLRET